MSLKKYIYIPLVLPKIQRNKKEIKKPKNTKNVINGQKLKNLRKSWKNQVYQKV